MSTRRREQILLPSRFVVCNECGSHGRIVFGDGWIGLEADSKRMATRYAGAYHEQGLVTDFEFEMIKEEIERSTLPQDALGEFALVRKIVEMPDIGMDELDEDADPRRRYH